MRQVFIEKTVYEWSELSKEVQNKVRSTSSVERQEAILFCAEEELATGCGTDVSRVSLSYHPEKHEESAILPISVRDIDLECFEEDIMSQNWDYVDFSELIYQGELLVPLKITKEQGAEIEQIEFIGSCSSAPSSALSDFIYNAIRASEIEATIIVVVDNYLYCFREELLQKLQECEKEYTTGYFFADGTGFLE